MERRITDGGSKQRRNGKNRQERKEILIHKAVFKTRLQTPIRKQTNPKQHLKLHKKHCDLKQEFL